MNLRPSGYEPDELPTAPLRDIIGTFSSAFLLYICVERKSRILCKVSDALNPFKAAANASRERKPMRK